MDPINHMLDPQTAIAWHTPLYACISKPNTYPNTDTLTHTHTIILAGVHANIWMTRTPCLLRRVRSYCDTEKADRLNITQSVFHNMCTQQ